MKHTSSKKALRGHAGNIGMVVVIGLLMLVVFILSPDHTTQTNQTSYPPLLWGYDTSSYASSSGFSSSSAPSSSSASSSSTENCGDGVDNDDNGLNDCEDPNCALSESCAEDCGNGIDDDGDLSSDCDDAWCEEDPACTE